MDKFVITGGRRLEGTVAVSGAKNAALPAMAAALLTDQPVLLHNLPRVRDIATMGRLLAHMQARVEFPWHQWESAAKSGSSPGAARLRAERISHAEAPYELVRTMRASVLVLGPLLGRTGYARVSLPGGCAIGARPVDLHIKALEQMGAEISTEHGYIEARAPLGLYGAHVVFEKITVTGTENILMAAALAQGETVLENCAREPEVTDLAALLQKMGAQIEGAGEATIRVRGVEQLRGAEHSVIPDRIEAGTLLAAGAITGGDVSLLRAEPRHLTAVLAKLEEIGAVIELPAPNSDAAGLRIRGPAVPAPADVSTQEYPGFPTDMQAQYMALATQADGTSIITETIFENRFLHASEMARMGADIAIDGRRAVVRGPSRLTGTSVMASDLRASAGLVLAALVAQGETTIDRVYHIDRGYERIEEKLCSLGARIRRVQEPTRG
ncbi:MAG TPA: UDP-N-acetylglucosamine 1-carboxyvinyltransferase [Candidatus Binatia bacterium]|nr:UDP-N-acetylglucosamine 1-carboxyvinyltransferase [Candidatus Binatia bacterium]